jgi:hypothetical protein
MSTAGDESTLARAGGQADEHRLEAKRADPQPHLIVLGHAAASERPAVVHRGELGERLAGDRATDSGERDRGSDGLANNQFFGVGLGELVAIMAGNPA